MALGQAGFSMIFVASLVVSFVEILSRLQAVFDEARDEDKPDDPWPSGIRPSRGSHREFMGVS
jgi:hypothetical protein